MSNDNLADATPVDIASDGTTFTDSVSNVGYTTEVAAGEPDWALRSAWWDYRPLAAGLVTLDASTSSGPVSVSAYIGDAWNDLVGMAQPPDFAFGEVGGSFSSAVATFTAVAGTTYHLMVYVNPDANATYNLSVTGPHSQQPPATVEVDLQPSGALSVAKSLTSSDLAVDLRLSEPEVFDTDPIEVYLGLAATLMLGADPIDVFIQAVAADAAGLWRGPVTPGDGSTVPSRFPAFTIQFVRTLGHYSSAEVAVHYSYLDGSGSTISGVLNQSVTAVPGLNVVTLRVTDQILGNLVTWTYSISYDGITTSDGITRSFQVTGVYIYDTPVTWSVQAGTPTPHLWLLHPSSGQPGDAFTAYGHGFTPASGTVRLNGNPLDMQTWHLIPATSNAATAARAIDVVKGTADAEHYEIGFTVPESATTGGQITIQD